MKKLDLSGNNIGDEGVEYLSLCLVSVEELYLEGCGITCRGASVLSEKISQLREPVYISILLLHKTAHLHKSGFQIKCF